MNDTLTFLCQSALAVLAVETKTVLESGVVRFAQGDRDTLNRWLERVLLNHEALDAHRLELNRSDFVRGHSTMAVDPNVVGQVVNEGVGAVSDDRILALALNGESLTFAFGMIQQRLPHAWLDTMARDGKELMEEHGVEIKFDDPVCIDFSEEEPTFSHRGRSPGSSSSSFRSTTTYEVVPENVRSRLRSSLTLSGDRLVLQPWLEQMLVNPDKLHAHIRLLQETQSNSAPNFPTPTDETIDETLESGLAVLDDAAFFSLLHASECLCELHDRISEQLPPAWFPAMAHDGRALMEEHGVSVTRGRVQGIAIAVFHQRPVQMRFRGNCEPESSGFNADTWDLIDANDSQNFAPPLELATRCYRNPTQSLQLRLWAIPERDSLERFRSQLEVTPPPEQAPFALACTFPGGEHCILEVPANRGNSVFSDLGPPMSLTAFQGTDWSLQIEWLIVS